MHERRKQMTTTASLPRRLLLCLLVVGTLGLGAFAAGAAAQAVPTSYTTTETVAPFTDVDLCTGLSGITTGTATEEWHFVNNADGTTHVLLTLTLDYRSDWSDGTYLVAHSPSHNEFQASPDQTAAEFTFAQQDRATIYSPDGQVIGYRTVFTQGHVTWINGIPITTPDQFRVTC